MLQTLEEFAKSKGKEVVDGVVPFGQDEAAALAFDREAYEAGIHTTVGISQAEWIHGKDDLSDAPIEFSVQPVKYL
jgi:hypothetical protein